MNICGWVFVVLAYPAAAMAQQPSPTSAATNPTSRATEKLVDSSIADDPAVDKMLEPYSPKVHALDNVIGTLKGELRKSGMGAGSLGNFVTDGMRAAADLKLGRPVDLAVTNSGGMRKNTITEGELRQSDIFELMPFDNALIILNLSGEQLMKVLAIVATGRDAQSGARVVYRTNADKKTEMQSAKLLDAHNHEREIDPKAVYTIVTIDYLVSRGGATYSVLTEGKNTRPLGVTLRDALIDYVKAETAAGRAIKPNLDGRFVNDAANSALNGAPPK
jgi:2',3'-cyclic-nucleotide 2'-phosphodiesterase (5'-nucleotidase family)